MLARAAARGGAGLRALGPALGSRLLHAGAQAAAEAGPSSTSTPGEEPEAPEDAAAIASFRAARNFQRRPDGRVLLHGRQRGVMEVKLDGFVEGSLLLHGGDGHVYYLVSEDLRQIDLSNDQLVGQLFGEGSWEQLMQPLCTQAADGALKHVKMSRGQFRSIFTVLKEAPPPLGPGPEQQV